MLRSKPDPFVVGSPMSQWLGEVEPLSQRALVDRETVLGRHRQKAPGGQRESILVHPGSRIDGGEHGEKTVGQSDVERSLRRNAVFSEYRNVQCVPRLPHHLSSNVVWGPMVRRHEA